MSEASPAWGDANCSEREQFHMSNRLVSHTEMGEGNIVNKESILTKHSAIAAQLKEIKKMVF